MNDYIDYRVTTHGKVLTVTKIATTDAYKALISAAIQEGRDEAQRERWGPFLPLLRWLRALIRRSAI